MRKWRKNGVVAEKPKPENPCKSRKNRRRMSIYEIRYRNCNRVGSMALATVHYVGLNIAVT